MFHLLTGLYSEWARPSTCNVLLVGPSRSGKTALLARLRHRVRPADAPSLPSRAGEGAKVKGIPPTVGQNVLDFRPPSAPSGVQVRLWDLGGAPSLREIWNRYLEETHVLLWALDLRLWDVGASGGNGKEKEREDAEQREQREEGWGALAAILPLLPLDVPLLIIASDLGYFGSELKRALEALEDAGEAANTASAREAEVQASEERAREAMRRLEEEYQGRLEGVGREARFVDGRSEESIEELLQILTEQAVRRKQR